MGSKSFMSSNGLMFMSHSQTLKGDRQTETSNFFAKISSNFHSQAPQVELGLQVELGCAKLRWSLAVKPSSTILGMVIENVRTIFCTSKTSFGPSYFCC